MNFNTELARALCQTHTEKDLDTSAKWKMRINLDVAKGDVKITICDCLKQAFQRNKQL